MRHMFQVTTSTYLYAFRYISCVVNFLWQKALLYLFLHSNRLHVFLCAIYMIIQQLCNVIENNSKNELKLRKNSSSMCEF